MKSIEKSDLKLSEKEKLISEAKNWYQKSATTTGNLNWDSASIFTSNNHKGVIIPYPFTKSLDKGGRSIRRIVISQTDKGFSGAVFVFLPTKEYSSNHKGANISDFSGLIGKYDLNMKFQYGEYYEQGHEKYKAVFKSFPSREAFLNEPKTEQQCQYYQESYMIDGVFTVYGYSVCVDDFGNTSGGSGGGVAGPSWEPGGGGGGGGTTTGGGNGGNELEHWDIDPEPQRVSQVQSISLDGESDEAEGEMGVPKGYGKIVVGAEDVVVNGEITQVYGYWAQPEHPTVIYEDNGRTVTRQTKVMSVYGETSPLPSAFVRITWHYILNYTYSYQPYSPPVTRQKTASTTRMVVPK